MKPLRLLSDSLAPAVDLIYPPRCPLCGEGIERQTGLCAPCWSTLVIPAEPQCASCQRPLEVESRNENLMCVVCMADPPRHSGITSATLYTDASRKLVLTLKHGRKIALAPLMGRLIAARMPTFDDEPLLVPVPLHRWRLWQRGFNQAALLAQELGKACGMKLVLDALVRRKSTPSLGGLGKRARARALAGALAVHPKHADQIKGRSILLVDDVLTSGATSNAATRALLAAGATSVHIACFARVIDGVDRPSLKNETPEVR